MQAIIFITTILLLIKIAYADYKQKIIPDKSNLSIALLGVFNLIINLKNCIDYVIITTVIFTVFLFIAIITDGGIGGGDIKLLSSLSLIFGIQMIEIIVFTFLIGGINSIYLLLTKKQKYNSTIALGPFICMGTIISLINLVL